MRWLVLTSVVLGSGCFSWGDEPEARECSGPGDYCECDAEGLEVPCFLTPEVVDGHMICRQGVRTCAGGMFTTCEDVNEYTMAVTHDLIEGPDECNACNPACQVNRDRPNDADLNPGNSSDVSYCPATGGICPDPNMTMPEDECVGPPCGDPFDLMMGDASGLAIDPTDGALILDSSAFNPDYIWIANTPEGTVSKYDIVTGEEEGRYFIGPFGSGNDPSRTSINTSGDAFVGGRNGRLLSRISASGDRGGCPDTNGDGIVTTSSDLNADGIISRNLSDGELLPYGADDCLLWMRDLSAVMPGLIRAVAAQDIVDIISGSVEEYVWVGSFHSRRLALLDGTNGAILRTKDITGAPYGFALDRDQNLWVSTISRNLYRVDTTLCNAVSCPPAPECVGDTLACQSAMVQRITVPYQTYGITVDFNQRVWLGGNGEVSYYDESLPVGTRARAATTRLAGVGGWRAGIAADGLGNVWTVANTQGVFRIDGSNPSNWVFIPAAASGGARGWGVAIDSRDNAWVINRYDSRAHKFTPAGGPATGLNNWTVTTEATNIVRPYTYSDMTGAQLRLAAAQRGTYFQTFEGCSAGVPQWDTITWDADTPPNTFLTWRARTGDTLAALTASTWASVGVVPGTITSPADVRTRLQAAGLSPLARYMQVELTLISADSDPTMVVTPRVREFSAQHTCITPTIGTYVRDYDTTIACTYPGERAVWGQFDYFSTVPATTTINLNIRVGDTPAEVAAATPSTYSIPPNPENGSFDMGNWLMMNGQPANPIHLQVEAQMLSSATATPTLVGFDLVYDCVPSE